LQALGTEVVGINASEEAAELGRAFCNEFHLAPLATTPEYLDFLVQQLERVDLFIPFIDEELVAIATGWRRIPEALRSRIAASEPSVLLDCVDKVRFQSICVEAEIPVAPEAVAPPAVFKPRIGRGGKGVVFAEDDRMFAALQGRDGVLQRWIRGEEFTVDAMFDGAGALLATGVRRRLSSAGVSTIGKVVADERLQALARRLAERWRFRYAINFQVIRDAAGQDWIIELNPRMAGSAIFSALAGCDLFAAALAVSEGRHWSGLATPLYVLRYWQELAVHRPDR
jgi:carbamoylphosphate synthase large subunit